MIINANRGSISGRPMRLARQLSVIIALLFSAPSSAVDAVNDSHVAPLNNVQTIVALSPHSVEMLFEIGLGDKIVATVEYADYPVEAQAIQRIGHSDFIDMEALLLLNPDIVVLSFEDTSQPLVEQLQTLGLPLFDTSVTTLDDIADKMQLLGQVTGQTRNGAHKAQQFRQKLTGLRNTYKQRQPVRVFYQIWPEPLTTVAGGWMNGLLNDCGAINIFESGVADYPQVSMEQILVRSPELILKPHYHGNSNQESINWNQWSEIPAVANQQIQLIKGDLVHRTGPRVVLGMERVCELVDDARQQRDGR